jgi:HSP20 family protein
MNSLLSPFGPNDSLLRSFFGTAQDGYQVVAESRVRPRVDIHEFEDHFEIQADMPGVRKEDLSVETNKGELVLRARREARREEKSTNVRRERYESVEYLRSFELGDSVDPDRIEGELRDGVLTLKLHKRERALPRRIEVK